MVTASSAAVLGTLGIVAGVLAAVSVTFAATVAAFISKIAKREEELTVRSVKHIRIHLDAPQASNVAANEDNPNHEP